MTKTQGIVFFGIIIVGLIVSIFTLNKCSKKEEVVEAPPPEHPETPDTPAKPDTPLAKPDPSKPETPDTPPATPEKFESADALVNALAEKIRQRDFEGFLEIAGPDAVGPNVRPELESLFSDPNYAPDADRPISELAKSVDSTRWSIKLKRQDPAAADGSGEKQNSEPERCELESLRPDPDDPCDNEKPAAAGPKEVEIYVDVVEDGKNGFVVRKISLPLSFTGTGRPGMKPGQTGAGSPGSGAPGSPKPGTGPGSPGKPGPGSGMPGGAADALTVAHAFSKAIVDRDFDLARQLTDVESVTDERVAALMIAMEEGEFHLRENKPLVVTLAREDITWVLTRVDSSDASSEFAMEMGSNPQAGWLINGLTFSKLIAALADAAGAGGVAYAPIVADPQGGDSLVLYFEFDEEKVSSRTSRQLEIIARILQKDPERKLHINGHADAMGTDGYNESLSNARAASVRAALIGFGAAPGQVLTKAFGEAMPRRPNFNPDGTDNPGGRSQNRRAEVYLDF